jgi:hypothetical protein
VLTEVTLKNVINGEPTHFSYEMIGMLKLNFILFIILAAMLYQLLTDYWQQYRRTERLLSPHPIMIISSCFQVLSVFFSVL